jgi:cell division protein FtsB
MTKAKFQIRKDFFKKRWVVFLVLLLGSLIIFNLIRSIIGLLGAEKKVGEAEKRVGELALEQEELLKKREYFESEEFVESVARDKLNLAREGETVVILPEEEERGEGGEESVLETPNWQKWLALFGWEV